MEPVPGLRVDGLSHTAQNLQRRFVRLLHMLIPSGNQRPNQGGSSVELLHLCTQCEQHQGRVSALLQHFFNHCGKQVMSYYGEIHGRPR